MPAGPGGLDRARPVQQGDGGAMGARPHRSKPAVKVWGHARFARPHSKARSTHWQLGWESEARIVPRLSRFGEGSLLLFLRPPIISTH